MRAFPVVATIRFTDGRQRESFLLELLALAGWTLRVRPGSPTTIRATRNDVSLEVTEASFPRAAGVVFARAMRSSRAR
jgi:hypothetical protein